MPTPAVAIVILALSLAPSFAGQPTATNDVWTRHRQECVNRQRRIIFNNDGNEPVYFCNAATADELLRSRTTPLAGSQVDSIFYCTWSSGFGLFTHHTKIGQVFTTREAMFSKNRAQEFLDKKIDPLRVMIQFAHSNRIELFWSLRMNDTHDGSRTEYGPVMFRANKLKQEHPDWLVGSQEHPPRFGAWSAVDYGVPEIRDLAFRYCEEVARNYDIDGIELDFLRHAFFFKVSGSGQSCSASELDQMTALLRRIRNAAEEAGRKRKRPILLAIRVPDSVDYCKWIGLDRERWLSEHLVDILVVGGYTQLNPWDYSTALGHKYGVKVYPSLDESRVRDDGARKLRETMETYRGRALNAWAAGTDGIYMFNFFDPLSPLWRELGDPALLRTRSRNYFASVLGMGSMPVPHQKFIHVPTLNPAAPFDAMGKGQVEFLIGEDVAEFESKQQITLHLRVKDPAASIRMTLNGTELPKVDANADWLEVPVQSSMLRRGTNSLAFDVAAPAKKSLFLLDLYVSIRP